MALGSGKLENVTVGNTAIVKSDCILTEQLKTVANTTNDVLLQTIVKKLLNTENSTTPEASSTLNCNTISNDMSSTTFNKKVACCYSKTNVNQVNTLSCVTAKNSVFFNDANLTTSCLNSMGLDVIQDTGNNIGAELVLEEERKARNKKFPTTTIIIVIIAIVAIIVIGAGAYYMYKKKGAFVKSKISKNRFVDIPGEIYDTSATVENTRFLHM